MITKGSLGFFSNKQMNDSLKYWNGNWVFFHSLKTYNRKYFLWHLPSQLHLQLPLAWCSRYDRWSRFPLRNSSASDLWKPEVFGIQEDRKYHLCGKIRLSGASRSVEGIREGTFCSWPTSSRDSSCHWFWLLRGCRIWCFWIITLLKQQKTAFLFHFSFWLTCIFLASQSRGSTITGIECPVRGFMSHDTFIDKLSPILIATRHYCLPSINFTGCLAQLSNLRWMLR